MDTNTYADQSAMKNHWWWRPGWQVGTRFYSWHVTLADQGDLHALADRYEDALAAIPTLDVIPRQWRHITLQGLGHVDEVDPARRDAAIESVRARLSKLAPITSTFHRAVVLEEAVALPPSNPETYTELRAAIREGVKDAWGSVSESAMGFRAHASIAYSNGDGDGRRIRAALDATSVHPATTSTAEVSLIRMHRDRQMYEWSTIASVSLG
jgi:2'-5' RNA ligase